MKKLSTIVFALLFSLPVFSANVVLTLGHIAEPTHPYGMGADYFASLVEKKSKGVIEIKVFPSSQLGVQTQLIKGLIEGTVDVVLTGTAELGTFFPPIALFDMPFLFKDRAHAYKSLDTIGMDFSAPLEDKGIKLLGYMESGIRHLTNNVRPIETPADMNGLKIRVMNNKVHAEMMKALGASPVPLTFDELYAALQQGKVDGEENPAAHIYTKRFYEVQKYASLTGHAYGAEPVLMSMLTWNKLTPAQQKIIQSAATESIAWQRELSQKEDNEFWRKIKKTGQMEVISVNRKLFIEATQSVYEQLAKRGEENVRKIRALKE